MRKIIYVLAGYMSLFLPVWAQSDYCESAANRTIVLGGAITEIVYALGAQDRIAGLDVTSTYPADANRLPKVGYYRRVGAEGLLSLGPDMIIADPDAGPPEALNQVSSVGVCVNKVGTGGSAQSVLDRVDQVAQILNIQEKGNALRSKLVAEFKAAENLVATKRENVRAPRILFLLSASDGTPVAAGEDTDANAIIELAGAKNAVSGFTGFKPLSSEIAASSEPDYILMMAHVVESTGGKDAVLSLPQIQLTPAGQNGNLIAMDGLLLLGFGPRTPEAIQMLASEIYD